MSFVSEYSMDMTYEVLADSSQGLTNEQLSQIGKEIERLEQEHGEYLNKEVVIDAIQEFLSSMNDTTKKVLQEQAAEEEKRRI